MYKILIPILLLTGCALPKKSKTILVDQQAENELLNGAVVLSYSTNKFGTKNMHQSEVIRKARKVCIRKGGLVPVVLSLETELLGNMKASEVMFKCVK